ncbi:hypothetical protein KC361_g7962 [Hortaea werneckii]|nr:hypothetical protein KC361_g7962 [Hortaea werneckii]
MISRCRATVTFKNDLETLREVHRIADEVAQERSKAQGGNVMGLDNKTDRSFMMVTARYDSELNDPVMHAAAQETVAKIKHATHLAGTDDDSLYLNYAGGFQDPIAGYGEASVAFLQATSERYDPGAIFQSRMPGGFKIGKTTENSEKGRTDMRSFYPSNDHQFALGSVAQEL